MQTFNINCQVRVKLTPEGRAAHAADHEAFWASVKARTPRYVPPREDAEGYSTWQLWSLMQAFGKHINLGGPLMFETNILLLPEGVKSEDKSEEHHCG